MISMRKSVSYNDVYLMNPLLNSCLALKIVDFCIVQLEYV
jgi:hypothetical protein